MSGMNPDSRPGGAAGPGAPDAAQVPPAPASPLAPVLAAIAGRFPGAVLETVETAVR
jgi:hypothetical protein